jgi:hypothetical protein
MTRRKTTTATATEAPEAEPEAPDASHVAALETERDALLRGVFTAGADELCRLYEVTHELEQLAAAAATEDAGEP